jgi:hypothetical protein
VETNGVKRKLRERWDHMIKGSANVVVSACEEGEGDYGEESYSIST